MFVHRRKSSARIYDQQRDIGFRNRQFSLLAHSRFQAVVEDLFQSGGVNHVEPQIADPRRTDPAIPRNARCIVYKR
jgi:hypothetical protein